MKGVLGKEGARQWIDTARRREALQRRLQNLSRVDVLVLGSLRPGIARLFADATDNLQIVLTGRQREHYLQRHPEMVEYERLLEDVVCRPDRVHRNERDDQVANFYRRLDDQHFLRATAVMQPRASKWKHSVITFRIASAEEVQRNRQKRVWPK